ncbi:alpha/beta hydrolase [Pelomyxa schiedti]|nr:alpha/beta hydrolase [Pelomyxa schiedti]
MSGSEGLSRYRQSHPVSTPPDLFASVAMCDQEWFAEIVALCARDSAAATKAQIDWKEPKTGFTALHTVVANGTEEDVIALLNIGANLQAETYDSVLWGIYTPGGRTPLHVAAQNGKNGMVRLLISKGAKCDALDSCGNTPEAVAYLNGHSATAQIIVHTPSNPLYLDPAWITETKRSNSHQAFLRMEAQLDRSRAAVEQELVLLRAPDISTRRGVKRIIFAPCSGSVHAFKVNWYASLAWELASEFGVETSMASGTGVCWRDLPDPNNAKLKTWIPCIKGSIGSNPLDTILIGHSSGADAVLATMETERVLGAVIVSGGPTEFDKRKMQEKASQGKATRELNWSAIKLNCNWIIHLHSVDDDVVSVDDARLLAKNLNSEYHELPNKGHFSEDEIPDLLPLLREKILQHNT